MADPEHDPEYSTAQSHPAYPTEPTSSWSEPRGSECGATLCVIAIFLAACLLLINSLTLYQGDERYYTDAAIRMMQSGDYLTPYYDDGRPRFLKPILSYWPLVASFRLFGINLPASRIPSIIAGCLVIWLTYQLAQVLFRHSGARCRRVGLEQQLSSCVVTRAARHISLSFCHCEPLRLCAPSV